MDELFYSFWKGFFERKPTEVPRPTESHRKVGFPGTKVCSMSHFKEVMAQSTEYLVFGNINDVPVFFEEVCFN